jgi:predicted DCC family thiol-disulfide oxidoreductase YuxK
MTQTQVLYNADCPICSFEIDHYRAYAARKGLDIAFDDLNGEGIARWGLDRDTAARRLYVLSDGVLLSGIDAFRALWQEMPRYRWLAWLTGLPGLYRLSDVTYNRVLAPLIYRWHLRRQARGKAVKG